MMLCLSDLAVNHAAGWQWLLSRLPHLRRLRRGHHRSPVHSRRLRRLKQLRLPSHYRAWLARRCCFVIDANIASADSHKEPFPQAEMAALKMMASSCSS